MKVQWRCPSAGQHRLVDGASELGHTIGHEHGVDALVGVEIDKVYHGALGVLAHGSGQMVGSRSGCAGGEQCGGSKDVFHIHVEKNCFRLLHKNNNL